MDVLAKLEILTDAAKYDAACTSSGVHRGFRQGYIGNTTSSIAGCCHTFSADGRCVTLLKVLMSNCCVYDCAYCVNRRSNDTRRAAFTPQELADLTINFYRRNYIEGLFLSSGVLRNPDYTMEQMIRAIRILREEYRFNGYIHAKAIPGAEAALFDEDSGPLRLAAMRFLCKLGATTEKRSEKVWPLIDEGIQCYHGDLEFQDMLLAVIDFSQGKLDGSVKSALADRMRFDAENGKGMLKRRAAQIIENVA